MKSKKIKACFHTSDIECDNCRQNGKGMLYTFEQKEMKLFEPEKELMDEIPPQMVPTMELVKVEGDKLYRLVKKPNGNYQYISYEN